MLVGSHFVSQETSDRTRLARYQHGVQITDKTISFDEDASIISRNAICFVDTCKYDSKDIKISCKHVKTATASVNLATVLQVQKNIVFCIVKLKARRLLSRESAKLCSQ